MDHSEGKGLYNRATQVVLVRFQVTLGKKEKTAKRDTSDLKTHDWHEENE